MVAAAWADVDPVAATEGGIVTGNVGLARAGTGRAGMNLTSPVAGSSRRARERLLATSGGMGWPASSAAGQMIWPSIQR